MPVKCPKGMCPIPAGRFKMRPANYHDERRGCFIEGPAHEVELSAYKMKKHPVTVGEYKAYLAEKQGVRFRAVIRGCGDKAQPRVVGKTVTRRGAAKLLPRVNGKRVCETKIEPLVPAMPELPEGFDGDDQPMVNVTWKEVRAYCQFYGMDLPTEAQWERGARGLAGNKEYGTASGKLSKKEAHYHADATAPVCSKPANDLGLCDMAGQVLEWTLDWYRKDGYLTKADRDPKGPQCGKFKVLRGGSWQENISSSLRAGCRYYAGYAHSYDIGFRCVSAPKESKK